jgi:hypothetical protein
VAGSNQLDLIAGHPRITSIGGYMYTIAFVGRLTFSIAGRPGLTTIRLIAVGSPAAGAKAGQVIYPVFPGTPSS